jgi:hypothetical protein
MISFKNSLINIFVSFLFGLIITLMISWLFGIIIGFIVLAVMTFIDSITSDKEEK